MDWAWGKEAQFRSDVVPQVGLDGSGYWPVIQKDVIQFFHEPFVCDLKQVTSMTHLFFCVRSIHVWILHIIAAFILHHFSPVGPQQ
jgi:hypothetical protein